jgi:hypothetical protein
VRALLIAVAIFSTSAIARTGDAAVKVHGAVLDDTAKKVGENRFKSTENWEKTIRFFRTTYGGRAGIVWSTIETPPKVRAIHIANTLPKRTWEGINVYEANGDVFIYVIKADPAGTPGPRRDAKTK